MRWRRYDAFEKLRNELSNLLGAGEGFHRQSHAALLDHLRMQVPTKTKADRGSTQREERVTGLQRFLDSVSECQLIGPPLDAQAHALVHSFAFSEGY
jgi:hypothetical protein